MATTGPIAAQSECISVTPSSFNETARPAALPELAAPTMLPQSAEFPAFNMPMTAYSKNLNVSNGLLGLKPSHTTPDQGHKGDVDNGFINVYGPEHIKDAARSEALKAFPPPSFSNSDLQVSEELLQTFADTYFDDCYAFCPVLDRSSLHVDLSRSPMLQGEIPMLSLGAGSSLMNLRFSVFG